MYDKKGKESPRLNIKEKNVMDLACAMQISGFTCNKGQLSRPKVLLKSHAYFPVLTSFMVNIVRAYGVLTCRGTTW